MVIVRTTDGTGDAICENTPQQDVPIMNTLEIGGETIISSITIHSNYIIRWEMHIRIAFWKMTQKKKTLAHGNHKVTFGEGEKDRQAVDFYPDAKKLVIPLGTDPQGERELQTILEQIHKIRSRVLRYRGKNNRFGSVSMFVLKP